MKRLKGILFLLTIMMVKPDAPVSAQMFKWAKQIGGPGSEIGNSITNDESGHVYITGTFSQTVDFDPGESIFNLTAGGEKDIFIEKIDQEGNLIWVKQLMGAPYGTASAAVIQTDSKGNVYTAGSFNRTMDFDPGTSIFNMTPTIDQFNDDGYLLKLDSAGKFIWAEKFGTSGYDQCQSLFIDVSDNLYFACSLNGISMLRKQTSDRQTIWEKQLGGYPSPGKSITMDSQGNIYIIGDFFQTADFDPDSGEYNLTSDGNSDIFILKLDAGGNFLWVKQIGGTGDDRGGSIVLDAAGNPVLTGYFSNTVDFNREETAEELTSIGQKDIFVLKLDQEGNFLWVRQIGGLYDEFEPSMATDEMADIYISGMFQDVVEFNINGEPVDFSTVGNPDFFIGKIDASGTFEWVKQIGGMVNECKSITVDSSGNIYGVGKFSYTVDFNPGPDTYNLTSLNYHPDIFIMKLGKCSPSSYELSMNTCNHFDWNGIIYDESGTYTQTISNTAGCDSIVTLNLVINTVDTNVSQEGNTLTANASGAVYQWIDCSLMTPLTGETNQTFTADSDGEYGVIVTQNECIDTSSCYSVTITGLPESEADPAIMIYPNPGTETMNVVLDHPCEKINVKIIGLTGRLFLNKNHINISVIPVDIKNLPDGTYFLVLESKRLSKKLKFIKS